VTTPMKAIIVGLLIAGVLIISSCNAAEEQVSQEEETTEETTETATTDPDEEIVERCQGKPGNVWDADKTLEEQVLGNEGYDPNDQPSTGTKYVALQEMRKHPEKDWCGGFTPRDGPYGIVPANEISAAVTMSTHESETRMQQAATGKNEAGQDVSNIPKGKVDPERTKCLSDYLKSSGNKAGSEQQRVVAEANARGVTPMDVVGC
jgi:hypothetical protein